MKIPLIIMAFLAFAQVATSQSFQKPLAQTVHAKQSATTTFTPVNDLFRLMPAGGRSSITPELPPEVRTYELLQIQEEGLQELIHHAPQTFTLRLPGNGRSPLEIELEKVNIFSEHFKVRTSASVSPVEVNTGLFYRGSIKGDPESIAAFSIFDQEVRGLFSSSQLGNLTLGRLPAAGRSGEIGDYILYDDRALAAKQEFECGTPDDGPEYTLDELSYTSTGRDANDCIRVYLEVDNDIYRDKGSIAAVTNYVTGLFNEVAVLYANESVNVVISEIFIWNSGSPYSGSNAGTLLSQFQNYRKTFDGDIGQLLSYQASGGIAVLSGLCHPYSWARLSFASINRSYNTLPSYSFSVMVVAHELGHLLGSQHTHACVWNGNNTAIDGCAGFTEGSCANPGKPAGGGTIMSYCHITSVGIDFSKGFGPQPGSVIRSKISQSNCTQVCSTAPPSTGGGSSGGDSGGSDDNAGCNEVFLTLTLDDFGPETTWEVVDAGNTVLHSGGPYAKKQAGTIIRETFCLPDGCYDFVIMDEDGDGICCDYGQGSFLLRDAANQTIASGGNFQYESAANFCLQNGANDGGGSDNSACNYIDLTAVSIQSYGGSQDQGSHQVVNGGTVLKLENNAWKAIPMAYTITPNTVLEFEFLSTLEGEIHGIGFDDDNSISYSLTFKVFGKQAWGRLDYDNYPGGGVWKKYSIPVGKFYTGDADRLFFSCDNDSPPYDGNAFYRNIVIHEGGACGSQLPAAPNTALPAGELRPEGKVQFSVFPNPASRQLQVQLPGGEEGGSGLIQIYNLTGQLMLEKEIGRHLTRSQVDLENLAQGTYLIRYDSGDQAYTERFTILRE